MSANLGGLGSFEEIGKQFLVWQVLSQIANAILGPALIEVTQDINGRVNRVALSAPDAVDAVVKGHWSPAQGSAEASLSGIDGERFRIMVDSAGEPPGLETLLEMYRRGIISESGSGADSTSLEQGIRESRLKNKWVPAIEAIRTMVLSPAEAVAAAVRGNLDLTTAREKAYEAGVDPQDFAIMVHNAGRPPSPGELAELLKRGLIPLSGTGPDALSFQQGIFEGDTKDKWWEKFAALADYIPPPRTVTALLKEGVLTEDAALKLFKDAGLSEELAQVYVKAASGQSKATAHELTKSEVLQLYTDGLLSQPEAQADLQKLGLSATDAKALLEHPQASRERQLRNQLVGYVRTRYVARKITDQQAIDALQGAGLGQDEYTHLLKLWQLERELPTQHVTAAEVASALHYGILDEPTAMQLLQSLGYHPWEAWLQLSVRMHGPLANTPEPALPALGS